MNAKTPNSDEQLFIKACLPDCQGAYEAGAGEGVFFIVDAETKAAYDNDEEKSDRLYYGILDNDSCYFIGLNHGERLPLEMRGEKRPVVPYEYLAARWELNTDFFNI